MRHSTTLCGATILAALAASPAHAAPTAVTHLDAAHAGEAQLAFTASAPGTDWGSPGHESAVLDIAVDGRTVANVVTFAGAQPFTYRSALGRVAAGRHTVTVRFDPEKSPPAVEQAKVRDLAPSVAPADDLVARYAPILYGRNLPEIAGAYENNHTDVPLLGYHTSSADAAGNRTIEYTVVWSNEDGGTNTPALMARWGRTTDIEWIYRVTVDAQGRRLSDAYQAANHATLPFDGVREADHPLLQTATANNNTSAVTDPAQSSGYRFALDTSGVLPAGRAREVEMDLHPWSYQIMAKEMTREGKVEQPGTADTPAMSDQRNYLFAEVKKSTTYPAAPPAPGTWAGTALQVQVRSDARWYASNHDVPDWSIQRDDPAATTVELPPGTTAADVRAVRAVAVPVGTNGAPPPSDYRIDVTAINRGFMLTPDDLPGDSFLGWQGVQTLTPSRPAAILWSVP
jgi:hypothetical protein